MTDNTDPAEIAASTVGRTLLKALADQLEATTKPWREMTEVEQHAGLERMRLAVRVAVTDALRLIFGQSMPACPATLEGLTSKGTITMRLTVDKRAANRHELLDAVGTHVVVLIGNPDDYLQGINDIKARAQQPGLFDAPELPPLEDDLDDAEVEPEPEPEKTLSPEELADADESNWIETARDRDLEQNIVTGHERRSRRAYADDLLVKVQDWNVEASHPSIRYDETTVLKASRLELLMALQWMDAYIADQGTEHPRPQFLLPERSLEP
jgi:hypothetical protein